MRTAAMLPFDLSPVIEDRVCGLNVSFAGVSRFTRWSKAPFALMVMRDRFDNLLTEAAACAGASVLAGSTVTQVHRLDGCNGFAVTAGEREVQARMVVGADGANSVVARATGLGRGMAESVALEAEILAPNADLERWRGVVNIDFGYRPHGYGWVFPKRQRLSIGLVLPPGSGRQLRPSLDTYLDRLNLRGARVERVVGHKLLFRRGGEPIAGDGVLLAGDAAGLADEFTEEGIFYAVSSGLIAAQTIRRALNDGTTSLLDYQRTVDRTIMPELHAARLIARLFYGTLRRAPGAMLAVSERFDYFWKAFFRVQLGVTGYDDELARAWWLRPFLPLVHHAAGS